MTASLTSLPLPILTFVVSAIAALLISRRDLGPALARGFFAGFFALIAFGSLMVGLRFGYGIEALVPLQRCLPLFGGPLLYLGFSALCRSSSDIRAMALRHFGFASLASLIITVFLREWNSLDLAIGASYLFYAARLFGLWRRGANAYALARLEIAPMLHRWALWGALFLLVSMVWDTVIALTFALGSAENAVTIISYASLVLLACLIIVLVAFASEGTRARGPAPEARGDAAEIEARARALLEDSQLYLDSNLSLERFAKRLQLPSRALSSAINQSQGVNVSQYVNGFRLAHAAKLLKQSNAPVAEIMEQSGFLTRSNFYREFTRVYGVSPAEFRKSA